MEDLHLPHHHGEETQLPALRRELEDKFAALLLEIDDAIAEEALKENQK